jgi:hypothetical protein
MTITVTAPNGSTVQFPDGTDHDTINSVMMQNFHPDSTPAAPTPDKYQQAAIDEAKANPAIDSSAGYTRRLTHGATLGADSTIMAAANTPFEMIKHGTFNPAEGYDYAKAREDYVMNKSRENTGALGTAAEILGGGVSGAGLANGGLTTARMLAPEAGLLARSAASAADAGAMGGFSGAMEGNGFKERFNNAIKGLATGAALGGLTPGVLRLAGAAVSPVVSNIRARINPQGFAESQVARGIHESGIDPNQISHDVVQAGNDGQGAFTVADAMGNPGQRLLSTVTRAPGEGRTTAVDALNARQAGQARRVAGTLAEGFNAPETAAQTETRLTTARGANADADYGAVRNGANQVDVTGTLNHLDGIIGTEPGQVITPANDSVEAALTPFRQRLSRVNPNDFEAVQRIRGDMADAAQSAQQNGNGNRARLIGGAVRQLDAAMENASPGYRAANANFAQASRDIDAVQAGRNAAMRGRTEDTIPAFQGLQPPGQQAFRSGYADPLIADAQKSPFGTNAARPLTNPAFQDESAVMAPGNPLMQRRLTRENTMFETRNAAMGGSKTADNLNDHAAMGVDPHLIGQIMTGNWHGAVRTALAAGHNALTGNTPEVRAAVAHIILQNGQSLAPNALREMVDRTVQRIQFVQNIARNVGRGAAGGLAVGVSDQNSGPYRGRNLGPLQ